MMKMMKKIGVGVVAMVLCLAGMTANLPAAHAAKVDCDQVMQKLGGGEKPKAIAKEMGISTSSVYRCKKKAKAAEGAGGGGGAAASPAETPPVSQPPAAPKKP